MRTSSSQEFNPSSSPLGESCLVVATIFRLTDYHHILRGHITATTTDTEPEMREFNLGPIGSDKKLKKQQKVRKRKKTIQPFYCNTLL